MATDKKRPTLERIAALMGNSSFIDLRDGVGGTNPMRVVHQDIAAALGFVAARQGKIAALVLETHYGSTLLHEKELARAWEESEQERRREVGWTPAREDIVLTRFAGALAVRKLAGVKYCTTQYAEYAYLIFSRREALQRRVEDADRWLGDLLPIAKLEFARALSDAREERKNKAA
jgi:hypothetical protein